MITLNPLIQEYYFIGDFLFFMASQVDSDTPRTVSDKILNSKIFEMKNLKFLKFFFF